MQMDGARVDGPGSLLDELGDELDVGIDSDGDALACWLACTLRNELGLADVQPDEDGDIPVKYGRSTVYVRTGKPDSAFVTVVALLLEGFEPSLEVYEAVNAINLQVPMAKTVVDVDDMQIVTSVQLPVVDTLSPHDLVLAIETVADTADYFDTLLQNRFGGATSFDA